MSRPSRRMFLRQALAAAGVGAVCPALLSRRAGAATVVGDVPRKFAICNEMFEKWPFERVCAFAAECGYGALEIAPFTVAQYVTEVSPKRRSELRGQAEKAGIRVVGLHWLLAKTEGLHLTSPEKQVRRKTAEYLGELAKFCGDLGGDVLVFGSPKQRNLLPGVSPEEAVGYAAEVLEQAMPVLEKSGVVLALEPLAPKETDFMTTAAEAVALAERVDSPHCRLLLDCKAMITEPTPIQALIRRYGRWLVHFHANDPNLQGPGFGDLDFVPVFEALREVRFRGWVSLEVFDYSPGPERLARESLAYMRRCAAKVGS